MNQILEQLGITWQLLVTQIIGFGILLFLLQRFAFKPIFSILDERQANIQATYDQLERDRASMEQTRRDYEQRLQNIEAEARERIQAAVKEAQGLRDNIVADARTQAESIVQRGQVESQREREKAFLEMRQQLVTLAVTAAGKVVGESLDGPRQNKLVDDFISSVSTGAIIEAGRGVSGNTIGNNGNGASA